MHSDTHKNSTELKKEVESQLNKVEKDVRSIDEQLTPGNFVDKVVFKQYRGNRVGMLEHMRDRPMGTAMFAAGLIALGQDEESRERMKMKAQAKRGEYAAKYQIAKNKVSDKIDHVSNKVSHKVDQAKNKISSDKSDNMQSMTEYNSHRFDRPDAREMSFEDDLYFAESMADLSHDETYGQPHDSEATMRERVGAKARDLKHKTKEGYRSAKSSLESAKDSMSRGMSKVSGKAREQYHENPSTLAALGFSLGALSSSSLPMSETEEQKVQEKSGSLIQRISEDLDDTLNNSIDLLKSRFISDLKAF